MTAVETARTSAPTGHPAAPADTARRASCCQAHHKHASVVCQSVGGSPASTSQQEPAEGGSQERRMREKGEWLWQGAQCQRTLAPRHARSPETPPASHQPRCRAPQRSRRRSGSCGWQSGECGPGRSRRRWRRLHVAFGPWREKQGDERRRPCRQADSNACAPGPGDTSTCLGRGTAHTAACACLAVHPQRPPSDQRWRRQRRRCQEARGRQRRLPAAPAARSASSRRRAWLPERASEQRASSGRAVQRLPLSSNCKRKVLACAGS